MRIARRHCRRRAYHGANKAEVERQIQFVARAVLTSHGAVSRRHLTHHHALTGVRVEKAAQVAQQPVGGLGVVDGRVRASRRDVLVRIVERDVLAEPVDDVDAKTVDAAIEPETHVVVQGGHELRVRPVQVGLRGQKEVQVVLAGGSSNVHAVLPG